MIQSQLEPVKGPNIRNFLPSTTTGLVRYLTSVDDSVVIKAEISKTDKVILAACMLLILVCMYALLNLEKFFKSDRSVSVVVGNLTAIEADVRHKSKSDYFWETSKLANQIYQGDSLFTGEKSLSVVTLNDGEKLQISQNSLVHFSGDESQLKIDLAFGSIKTSGLEKPLLVTDCGQKYLIESTQAQFELSKSDLCGSFQLLVKTGTVQVTKHKIRKTFSNTDTRKVTLPDSFASSSPAKRQLVIPLVAPSVQTSPELLATPVVIVPELEPAVPALDQIGLAAPEFKKTLQNITLESDTKVRLSWTPVLDAKTYGLEISNDKKFNKSKMIQVKTSFYSFSPPTSGTYFFRVKAFSSGSIPSPVSKLAVVKTEFPPIEVVQSKFVNSYQARSLADTGQAKKFPLSWNLIPTAEKYVIEVDNSSEFTNPTKTEVLVASGDVEVPRAGNYYFRVSALDTTGRKISSMPSFGEIAYKKLDQISGPLIDNAYKSLSFYFQKEYGQFIWLRWKSSLESFNYRVQVAQDRDFNKINLTFAAADTKVLIKSKLLAGNYFWRVRSESPENISAWSETSELKVRTK